MKVFIYIIITLLINIFWLILYIDKIIEKNRFKKTLQLSDTFYINKIKELEKRIQDYENDTKTANKE